MKIVRLGDLAKISISNVDKKSKPNELKIKLCNFTDVYYNWAISSINYPNLMTATANSNAIEKFSLKKGDVAITKDSETRNDIGIATYISENFNDVVLGYHCALISPNQKLLYGKYLNMVLHTYFAQKYFEANASGSGQRYTLTNSIIENMPIPLIDMPTQKKIGDFMSFIDRKIETNNKINAELEAMAKTIYDYWFIQFDFPDQNGKPYRSSGGAMVWNEQLKRDIPKGWQVENLSNYIDVVRGVAYDNKDTSNTYIKGYIPLLKSNNIQNDKIILNNIIYVNANNVSNEQFLDNNSIFVTMSSGSTEHVGKTAIVFYDMPYCYGAFCSKIKLAPKYKCFLSLFFTSDYFKRKIRTIVIGTSIKNINNNHIINNLLAFPPMEVLNKFENTITPIFNKQGELIKENQELSNLRDWLLPLLMNGQAGFKDNSKSYSDERFEMWLEKYGYVARGITDIYTLREVFEVMDDEDK